MCDIKKNGIILLTNESYILLKTKSVCFVVRFVAFLVTEYDEVFSGYQPGQMVEW